MDVIDGRFEPVKRTAVDGKTWWVVYDNKRHGYSSYICHGKYETRKQCEQAIKASYKYFCGVSGEAGRSVERREKMTNYNDLRDGQEFYANGYKKGYEDAKKEFESKIITKAISEELEALPKEIDGDKLLMLSTFGAGVRFNILGKLKESKKDDMSPDVISKILADFILDDIENADEDFVKEKFETLGVTQELLDTLGVDYRLEGEKPSL